MFLPIDCLPMTTSSSFSHPTRAGAPSSGIDTFSESGRVRTTKGASAMPDWKRALAIAIAAASYSATPLQLQPAPADVLYEGATVRKTATVGDTRNYEAVLS